MSTNDQKINDINKSVQDVTDIMNNNIEKVIQRGEKIEDLNERTIRLKEQSIEFKNYTKKLACKEQLRAACFCCPLL